VQVEPAVLTDPVQSLVARRTGGFDVHDDLQAIKVTTGFLSQQFSIEHLDVRDFLDAFADIVCTCQCSIQQVVASLDHLSALRVQCGVDHHVGARSHQQIGAPWTVGRRLPGRLEDETPRTVRTPLPSRAR
jgi:hypothetical protein